MKIGFVSAIVFMIMAGGAGVLIRFVALRAEERKQDEQIISQAQSRD
jgi:hypothetical protein